MYTHTHTHTHIYIYIFFFNPLKEPKCNGTPIIIIIPSAQILVSNTINKRKKAEILRDILNGVSYYPAQKF